MDVTRTALVTGGTRGIGAAICEALVARGMRVIANYRSGEEAADRFTAATDIPAISWDVADPAACSAAIAEVNAHFGPIDVLVNNAGITRDASLVKMSHEMWDAVIDTNLSGAFNCIKEVYPGMRERGWGRIVNISSINGQNGQFGQVNYAAAKAGLVGMTKSLAREGASRGVTANVVAPGYTETDMVAAVPDAIREQILAGVPTGRFSRPDEIARVVAFLCDEESGQITGSTITVNGGHYMV